MLKYAFKNHEMNCVRFTDKDSKLSYGTVWYVALRYVVCFVTSP
jgi:hypothetical protein